MHLELPGSDPPANKAIEFSRGEFGETVERFSPDGEFIAYRSDEDNPLKREVYVRPFDAAKGIPGMESESVKGRVNAMIHWRADGKGDSPPRNACRRMCPRRRISSGGAEGVIQAAGAVGREPEQDTARRPEICVRGEHSGG